MRTEKDETYLGPQLYTYTKKHVKVEGTSFFFHECRVFLPLQRYHDSVDEKLKGSKRSVPSGTLTWSKYVVSNTDYLFMLVLCLMEREFILSLNTDWRRRWLMHPG
jgi:hypothetical protein